MSRNTETEWGDGTKRGRRRILQAIGIASLGSLAGCTGDDEDPGDEDPGDDEPSDDDPGDDEPSDDDPGDDEPGDPAHFEVTALSEGEPTVQQGHAVGLTANIENTGDQEGTQDIEFRIEGDVGVSRELSLDGGENSDIRLDGIETDHLDPGEYQYGVYTEDDEITGILTIEAPPEIEDGIIHHWPMGEGEGDVVGDVVGGEDGTITGGVNWVENNWAEGYALENPSNGVVEFSTLGEFGQNRNEDFAIVYTLDSEDTSAEAGVMGSYDENTWGSMTIYYSNSFFGLEQSVGMTIRMAAATESAVLAEENELLTDGPHRVVINKITNDSENWEIFVDGEKVPTETPRNAAESIPPMEGNFQLFEDGFDPGNRPFEGVLDNVQIHWGTLDGDDVVEDYENQPWS